VRTILLDAKSPGWGNLAIGSRGLRGMLDGCAERRRTALLTVRTILATAISLLGIVLVSECSGQSTGERKPPSIHIDKGACPFECCTYREWVARIYILSGHSEWIPR